MYIETEPSALFDIIRECAGIREVGGDVPWVVLTQWEDVVLEFGRWIIVFWAKR